MGVIWKVLNLINKNIGIKSRIVMLYNRNLFNIHYLLIVDLEKIWFGYFMVMKNIVNSGKLF